MGFKSALVALNRRRVMGLWVVVGAWVAMGGRGFCSSWAAMGFVCLDLGFGVTMVEDSIELVGGWVLRLLWLRFRFLDEASGCCCYRF